MSVWMIIISCWVLGSFPLAMLVGKVLAHGPDLGPVVAVDELSFDVDAFLERVFAA